MKTKELVKMEEPKWVYTKAGEEKWKNERLPEYRDDSHNEGIEVPKIDYRYCSHWEAKGWVKKV
jgi:hypothetical protein